MTEAEHEKQSTRTNYLDVAPLMLLTTINQWSSSIDLRNPAGHSKIGPINIVTVKLAYPALNVRHSVRLGRGFL